MMSEGSTKRAQHLTDKAVALGVRTSAAISSLEKDTRLPQLRKVWDPLTRLSNDGNAFCSLRPKLRFSHFVTSSLNG